jgi:hypothetical protein
MRRKGEKNADRERFIRPFGLRTPARATSATWAWHWYRKDFLETRHKGEKNADRERFIRPFGLRTPARATSATWAWHWYRKDFFRNTSLFNQRWLN